MTFEGYGIQRARRLRVLVNPNGGVVRLTKQFSFLNTQISYDHRKGALPFFRRL